MRCAANSIPLTKIVVSFFVRKLLDEGRVRQLIKLYEAKLQLPPLKVWYNEKTELYEIIDGRHRFEAAKRMEWDATDCNVIDEPDFAKRVGLAVSANSSGPLTATDEDFEVALQALLDANVSVRRILDVFPLPRTYTMKVIHNVKSKLYKVAVTQAVDAMLNQNLTVHKAAEEFKVEVKAIRERVVGYRKAEKDQITDFTGGFSHRFRSFSKRNSDDCKKLIEQYDLGKMSPEAIRHILKSVVRSGKNAVSALEDYQQRFEARISEDLRKEA